MIQTDRSNFVAIGKILQSLSREIERNNKAISVSIEKLEILLEREKLSNSMAALQQLSIVKKQIDLQISKQSGFADTIPSENVSNAIISAAKALAFVVNRECREVDVVVCKNDDFPESFNTFFDERNLPEYQLALFHDVSKCLKVGASRPAIVLSWNLCFDFIRSWIYADESRLGSFNKILQERNQKIKEVIEYDDFFQIGERFTLDCCHSASGAMNDFTSKIHSQLVSLLDRRNAFAHVNYRKANQQKAISYLDEALDVISEYPFKEFGRKNTQLLSSSNRNG